MRHSLDKRSCGESNDQNTLLTRTREQTPSADSRPVYGERVDPIAVPPAVVTDQETAPRSTWRVGRYSYSKPVVKVLSPPPLVTAKRTQGTW